MGAYDDLPEVGRPQKRSAYADLPDVKEVSQNVPRGTFPAPVPGDIRMSPEEITAVHAPVAQPPVVQPVDRPAQMTVTRGGQPVIVGQPVVRPDPWQAAGDALSATQPGTPGFALQGAPAAIETLGRTLLGFAGGVGAAPGIGAAGAADVIKGTPIATVADRIKDAMGLAGERFVPKKTVFAPTPMLEEAFGHVLEAARDYSGVANEKVEQARGDILQGVLPEWLGEYVKARPEAARTLGEAGFDLAMLLGPAKGALNVASRARQVTAGRAAAAEEARFKAAEDVTQYEHPQYQPPTNLAERPGVAAATDVGTPARRLPNPYADLPERTTNAPQVRPQPENNLGQYPGTASLVPPERVNRQQPPAVQPSGAEAGGGDRVQPSAQVEGRQGSEGAVEPELISVAAPMVTRDASGRIIGGFGAEHMNAVHGAIRRMVTLAKEGEQSKDWYPESAKAIVDAVGGDPIAAQRFAQVLAITSAGTEIKANFTVAEKALEQYARGEPIKVTMGTKNAALNDLLYHGVEPESIKVDDFYRNLAQHITGELHDRPVTDRWQFRIASGKGDIQAGGEQQYKYASMLASEAAKKLGMRPDQAQAAMWVAMKARSIYENIKTAARESVVSKYKGASEKELRAAALARAQTSYGSEIERRNWKPPLGATFPTIDELKAAHQTVTAETAPSTKTSIGRRASNLPLAAKQQFQRGALDAIGGVAGLMADLGLDATKFTAHPGGGGYEGAISPNVILSVRADEATAERVAKAWMYVFQQDAVPYFQARPELINDPAATRGVAVTVDNATPGREKKFFDLLRERVDPAIGYTRAGDTFLITNYHGQDVNEFLQRLDTLLQSADNPLHVTETGDYGAKGQYPTHDWTADPAGQALLDQAAAGGSPALQARLRDRADRFRKFAERALPREPKLPAAPGDTSSPAPGRRGSKELISVGARQGDTPGIQGTPAYVAAEASARRVFADYPAAKAQYEALPDSHGGRVLNPDISKEMVPEYLANRELASAVHEAGSDFIKRYYQERLDRPTPEGMVPMVVFTAGGPGSGKSTAIGKVLRGFEDKAELFYDSSLSNYKSARQRIDAALDSGRLVQITFVDREPAEAYKNGVITRIERGLRRVVPIAEHARSHVESRQVIAQLAEHYKDNPNFWATAIDNNGTPEQIRQKSVENVSQREYNDVHAQTFNVTAEALQAGRLPPQLFETATGRSAQEISPGAGERHGREPQAAGQDQVSVALKTGPASKVGFTSRRDLNAMRPPDEGEMTRLVASLDRLVSAMGLPEAVAKAPFYLVDTRPDGNQATYFPEINTITIAARNLVDTRSQYALGLLDSYVAHELHHMMDRVTKMPDRPKDAADVFVSAKSPRMEIVTTPGGVDELTIDAVGDLAQEIFSAMADNGEIEAHFDYPFANLLSNMMDREVGQIEMLAQAGSLFVTSPHLVKKFMPKWHAILEGVHGNESNGGQIAAPQSVGEAHARLQNALQEQGAGEARSAGVTEPNQPRVPAAQDQGVSARGPPERGVGISVAAGKSAAQRAAERAGLGGRGAPPAGAGKQPPLGRGAHWDIDEPGLVDNFVREWQNNKLDLRKVQEAIERAGGILREETMPYLLDELHQDRAIARVKQFVRNGVQPLLEDIRKSGLTIDDVGDYLWARHAPEANAHLDKINPGGPKNLSGLYDTKADAVAAGEPDALNAADIISGIATPANRAALGSIAAKIDAITQATRRLIINEGLEDKTTIQAWENAYRHYVPLFRDVEGEPGIGNSLVVKGPESKRRLGSQREARAILAAVIAQHAKVIYRAEKATVGRALVKLAEENPNPDFWKVDTPPMKQYLDPAMQIVRSMVDPIYKNRDDVFVVKDRDAQGKVVERSIEFNPRSERAMKLAAAMRALDAVQLGAVTQVAGHVNRYFANIATQWNPHFWLTNPIRDYQDMVINLQSTPLKGKAASVTAKIPRAIAGIASAEFRDGSGTWAKIYRELENQGGTIGWANIYADLEGMHNELQTIIDQSQRSAVNPLKWAEVSLDAIGKVNRVMEVGTRVAVYKEARDSGLSERQAASLAKNITVNFRRKGNRSTATNAWYLFFNARVQGTARMIRALKDRRVQAVVAVLTGFAAALELSNRLIGDRDRDEDENNPYDLIPEFVKQNNTIVMLPPSVSSTSAKEIKNKNGKIVGRYLMLPMPYGYNLFAGAGRLSMEAILQASNPKMVDVPKKATERMADFLGLLMNTFSPLSNVASALQQFVPSMAQPVVQYLENKTWYGAPLRPEPLPFGPKEPNYKQYFRTTSDTAKEISRWLSDVSGGDEVKGGSIDISPATISHVFGTLTGGTGRFGLGALEFGQHMVGRMTGERAPEDLPWRNVPFVGKVYGEITDREVAGKYYALRKKALDAFAVMKSYEKIGERDKAEMIEQNDPELIAMARELQSKHFKKDMKGVREEFKAIDQLPKGERAKARRELGHEETTIMNEALRAYNEQRRAP